METTNSNRGRGRRKKRSSWLRNNPRAPTKPAGGERPRPRKGAKLKGTAAQRKLARKNARKATDIERDKIMAARRATEKSGKPAAKKSAANSTVKSLPKPVKGAKLVGTKAQKKLARRKITKKTTEAERNRIMEARRKTTPNGVRANPKAGEKLSKAHHAKMMAARWPKGAKAKPSKKGGKETASKPRAASGESLAAVRSEIRAVAQDVEVVKTHVIRLDKKIETVKDGAAGRLAELTDMVKAAAPKRIDAYIKREVKAAEEHLASKYG